MKNPYKLYSMMCNNQCQIYVQYVGNWWIIEVASFSNIYSLHSIFYEIKMQ